MELWEDKQAEAAAKLEEVKVILASEDEDRQDRANPLIEAVKALKSEASQLKEIGELGAEFAEAKSKAAEEKEILDAKPPTQFSSMGKWLIAVGAAGDSRQGYHVDQRLLKTRLEDKDDMDAPALAMGAGETKATMVENVGARGGFLVPTEFRAELLGDEYEKNFVRQRATIIPMARRQVNIPTLDQTGTTANLPHQYGGMVGTWIEEATEKTQSDP